jgi:laccase
LENGLAHHVVRFIICVTLYWQVTLQNVTRLGTTRAIPTVNGKFPGPKIVTREGDRVVVRLVNNVKDNVTIHW